MLRVVIKKLIAKISEINDQTGEISMSQTKPTKKAKLANLKSRSPKKVVAPRRLHLCKLIRIKVTHAKTEDGLTTASKEPRGQQKMA